jgi:hypothetical protein
VSAVLVMAVAYGLVCGSMMLAGEREGRTLDFLDVHSGRRAPVWRAKALTGAVFTVVQALLLAGVVQLAGLPGPRWPTGMLFWLLPVLALDGYAWGLVGSALCRNVFAAAVLASVLLGGTWAMTWLFGGGALVLRAVFAFGAGALSHSLFCRPDWERAGRPTQGSPSRRAPAWRVLLWLTWRQGRIEMPLILGVGLLLGVLLPLLDPLLCFPVVLVAGVLCGAAVFAEEQQGSSRFLADQRLPVGRVWAVKVICWGTCAVAAAFAVLAGVVLFSAARAVIRPGDTRGDVIEDLFDLLARDRARAGLWIFPTMPLAYGFAAGHLAGMVFRKRLPTLIVGGGVAVALVALWLPSVVLGGLPLWQLLGPPLILVLAGQLMVRWWINERLGTWKAVTCLVSCTLAVGLWMTGALWYRVAEVPDPGPPFDRRAFEADLTAAAAASEAGELFRQAAREWEGYELRVTAELGPPKKRPVPAERPEPAGPDGGKPVKPSPEGPDQWWRVYQEE